MDFLIVPHMNPDGYEFSRLSNRMWRKSRKPTSNPSCVGTDLNRNFEFMWGGVGASTNPCSDTYRGAGPVDEQEVMYVQQQVTSRDNILVYIDTHSYGNYFLSPWGYTSSLPQADYPDHLAAGKAAADAIYDVDGGRYGGYY